MRIPNNTKKSRYYVATSSEEAFSSWGTLQDAVSCIDRFVQEASIDADLTQDLNSIRGIIKTNTSGKLWVYKL